MPTRRLFRRCGRGVLGGFDRHRRLESQCTDMTPTLPDRSAAGEPKTTLAREFGINRETVYQYLRPTGSD